MKFWTILTLAASIAAFPLESISLHKRNEARTHIGFRMVNHEEAAAIKLNGGKAVQSNGRGAKQLGKGTYITAKFQAFKEFDEKYGIPWDCSVTIDADVWNGYKKAWIPKEYVFPEDLEANPGKCKPLNLWSPRPDYSKNRRRFLTHLDESFTQQNTVLFSKINSHEEVLQVLFPPEIIATEEIYMQGCAQRGTEANTKIGEYGTVNWGVESIKGWNMGSDAGYTLA